MDYSWMLAAWKAVLEVLYRWGRLRILYSKRRNFRVPKLSSEKQSESSRRHIRPQNNGRRALVQLTMLEGSLCQEMHSIKEIL